MRQQSVHLRTGQVGAGLFRSNAAEPAEHFRQALRDKFREDGFDKFTSRVGMPAAHQFRELVLAKTADEVDPERDLAETLEKLGHYFRKVQHRRPGKAEMGKKQ